MENLVTSSFIAVMRDKRDISMNSDSVYIWRPPWIIGSTWYSIVNSFPWLLGLALRAYITSAYSDALSSTAEMIVIFSSLLKAW